MEIITRQFRPAPASQFHESVRLSLPSRRRCVCSPVCAFGKRVNQTQGVKVSLRSNAFPSTISISRSCQVVRLRAPTRQAIILELDKAFSKASSMQTVPVTQDKPAGSVPMALKIGAVLVLVAAAVKIVNKIRNQGWVQLTK